jgi:hypothetical protein
MARTVECMNEDGNRAVFIGTSLMDGSSVTLCDGCLVAFAGAIIEGALGIPYTVLIGAVPDANGEEDTQTSDDPIEVEGSNEDEFESSDDDEDSDNGEQQLELF